jgi:hypothetical protein
VNRFSVKQVRQARDRIARKVRREIARKEKLAALAIEIDVLQARLLTVTTMPDPTNLGNARVLLEDLRTLQGQPRYDAE